MNKHSLNKKNMNLREVYGDLLDEPDLYPRPKNHSLAHAKECVWKATSGLIQRNTFFSYVLQQMRRIVVDAGCGVDLAQVVPARSGTYFLFVNRATFPSLTKPHQMMVLRHEAAHIALAHLDRMEGKHGKMWNLATDMVINAEIRREAQALEKDGDLPAKDFCMDEVIYPFPDWPQEATAELYYDKLMEMLKKKKEELEQVMEGFPGLLPDGWGAGGGHDPWDELRLGDEPSPNIRAVRRMILEHAMDAWRQAGGRGEHPGSASGAIKELIQQNYPFQKELSRFLGQHLSAKRVSTWMRKNRRIPGKMPGKRRTGAMTVWVVVDTSGSVSNHALAVFGGHIERITKSVNAQVMVVEIDADVQAIYEFRGTIDRSRFTGKGRGGTVLGPAFMEIPKARDRRFRKPSCVVVLTDGYFESGLVKPPWPVLFCIPADAGPPAVNWGRHVVLPPAG